MQVPEKASKYTLQYFLGVLTVQPIVL